MTVHTVSHGEAIRSGSPAEGGAAFCTVEYLDERGESVITHAILTVEQQAELIREFAEHGIVAQIIPHAPPDVPSEDDTIPRLGSPLVRGLQ